jgi:hypothetical protein
MEAGNGILVSHAARKAQCVGDCLLIGVVGPEPRSSQRRPELRAVNGDDPPIPASRIAAKHDLLVSHFGQHVENFHQ